MKRPRKRKKSKGDLLARNRFGTFLWVAIVGLSLCPFAVAAEGGQGAAKRFNVGDFSFAGEKLRNPFEPVYLLKAKRDRAMKGDAKNGFELEELKFVGTLKTDKGRSAMMEDMQGKGMLFKKGDYLNRNLWVLEVLDNRLVLGYKLKDEIRKMNVDIPKQ
jgi:hypothetical protein